MNIKFADVKKKISFKMLEPGEVFIMCGHVYIKTTGLYNIYNAAVSAVNVVDGKPAYFQNDDKVFLFIGELVENFEDKDNE